jgi:hypothetical protein
MRLVQVQVLRVREFDSRPLLSFSWLRYGVVGNMSGFHPVASGSIPGSGSSGLYSSVAERSTCNAQVRNSILRAGFAFFPPALVAQLAERQLYTLEALGSIPDESLLVGPRVTPRPRVRSPYWALFFFLGPY